MSTPIDLLIRLIEDIHNGDLDHVGELLGEARLVLYKDRFGPMPVKISSEDTEFFGLIDLKNEPELMSIIERCNKVVPRIIVIDVFDRERSRWFNLNYLEDSIFTTTTDIDPTDPRLEKVFSLGVTTLDRLLGYFFE